MTMLDAYMYMYVYIVFGMSVDKRALVTPPSCEEENDVVETSYEWLTIGLG